MKSSVAAGARAVIGDYLHQPGANGSADDARGRRRVPTSALSRAAIAFRTFHAAIAAQQLLAIAYVWWCALTGRRDRLLRIAVATLLKAYWLPPTTGIARWADCKKDSAIPCPCSSWYSRRAPQNGRCRRWAPSPAPGLSCWLSAGGGEGSVGKLRGRRFEPAAPRESKRYGITFRGASGGKAVRLRDARWAD